MADFAITPTTGRALSSSNSTTCGLIVERHVPKCAGTTVRTFLRANQERGACSYVGYDVGRTWQSRVGFTHRSLAEVADELNSNPSPWNKPICMEAHMVGGSFWSVLSSLRQSQFAARCTMLVMLRVREPLSWYRSYYDWAVLSRQKTGDSVQWGTNFTDWLPSNMQSRFLLHGTRATSRHSGRPRWREGGAAAYLKSCSRSAGPRLRRLCARPTSCRHWSGSTTRWLSLSSAPDSCGRPSMCHAPE